MKNLIIHCQLQSPAEFWGQPAQPSPGSPVLLQQRCGKRRWFSLENPVGEGGLVQTKPHLLWAAGESGSVTASPESRGSSMSLSVNNETSFQFPSCPKLHRSPSHRAVGGVCQQLHSHDKKKISKCVSYL